MDSSLPGSNIHGILQAKIQKWIAMPSSRGFSQPWDWTQVSQIACGFFTVWATNETQWSSLLFFNLSLNFSRRSHGLSQSAPGLVLTDCIELLYLWLKEYKQSDFDVDHLVMSMCRVFFCVVGRGCLLWPVHSPGKTLLAFALLHFVLQGQTCLLNPGISWLPTFVFHSPMMKRMFFLVLVLEGLVGLHSSNSASSALAVGAQTWITVILNGLPWKPQRSLCHSWDCTQILHFRLFCWLWGLLHFF